MCFISTSGRYADWSAFGTGLWLMCWISVSINSQQQMRKMTISNFDDVRLVQLSSPGDQRQDIRVQVRDLSPI